MTLLVATTNAGKLQEIRDLLAYVPFPVFSLNDLPSVQEPEETGETFEENARQKALYYAALVAPQVSDDRVLTLAEDSGLVIDALGGEPGVRSGRFLRADATYPERFTEIDRRLRARPDLPRTARFVCAVAVVENARVAFETRGTVEGEIAPKPAGTGGFGYDPIFYFPPYGSTLAQVTREEKLRAAHRGKAFRAVAAWLQTKNGER